MDVTKDTPRRTIVVGGLSFSAPAPYAEGHVCTANEAAVLNQTLGENLGNNFRKNVTEARKAIAGKDAKKEALDAVPADQLPIKELTKSFEEMVSNYEFGVRHGGVTADPVEREARDLALLRLKKAVSAKGMKFSSISTEKRNELVGQILEKNPDIYETAKRRVKQAQEIAGTEVDGLDFSEEAAA